MNENELAKKRLYYFNARYYDQTIGRFINVDPIQDGLNWYVYANNNPLNRVDPTGLASIYHRDMFAGNDKILQIGNAINMDHWLVAVKINDNKNNITQFHSKGFQYNEKVGARPYIVEYSGMDDNLTAKAITNTLKLDKYGAGDKENQAKSYNPLFNNCNNFTSDVFKEYKNLWVDNQKSLHENDNKFDVNKAWDSHFKDISKDRGKEIEFQDLNKNKVAPKVEEQKDKIGSDK